VNVVRYADDFVITGNAGSPRKRSEAVGGTVPSNKGAFAVHGENAIVNIAEGFDFLGWNFRKYSGTLLIKPSKENAQRSIAR
jgi:RNA-directed DNA polymerase